MHPDFPRWFVWHPLLTFAVACVVLAAHHAINAKKSAETRRRGLVVVWCVIAGYFFGGCFGLWEVYKVGSGIHPVVWLSGMFGLVVGVVCGNLLSLLLALMTWESRDPDVPPCGDEVDAED